MKEVLKFLEKSDIQYDIVYHPAAYTTDEADIYVKGKEGVLTKTIFMAGKKDRNFYMFIMDENKRLDIKKINEVVNDKLHFAKEEHLKEKLNLSPGSVSLFGLLNNVDHDIKVYIDKEIVNEKNITFHPNENTATIFIKIKDMFKVLNILNYQYILF